MRLPVAKAAGPTYLIVSLLLLLVSGPALVRAGGREGVTHVLLLNGGAKPALNYLSHLHHLQDMLAVLEQRGIPRERIHVFSADGEDSTADLAVRDTPPRAFWLLEGTRVGAALRPRTRTTNTVWEGVDLKPARKKDLESWFRAARYFIRPKDRLLIFVTDHGTENKSDLDNGAISLWNEALTVREFEALLARLKSGVQVVMLMSQCYSGTFASAMEDRAPAEPSGRVCGFFSTARDLRAFGCYAEGRDRDRIGHAFGFIEALGRRAVTDEAHVEVLFTDRTPDVPLRTSDVYLERIVEEAARARGVKADALVDEMLGRAWRDRAAWEPEIRLIDRIGSTFGMFSPRSLAELAAYAQPLPDLIERAGSYARRWESARASVAEEALKGFVESNPEWRERLAPDALKKLGDEERRTILADLLPELERYGRERAELWSRLEGLQERSRKASEAGLRLEIRRAGVRRMRAILVGTAARVLLEAGVATGDGPARTEQAALERLEKCEAFEPGFLPLSASPRVEPQIERLPPVAEDLRLLDEVLPAWIGVQFGPVPEAVSQGRELSEGATWLSSVLPDSPAAEAGLEGGDIVLGPPGAPFTAPGQLRERVMTSPPGASLRLLALRPASNPEEDRPIEVEVRLRPLPEKMPKLPAPPEVGDPAPALPEGLVPVGEDALPVLVGKPHVLFFWATWCGPCKRAVPEVMAFSAAQGIPVLAITDEDSKTVEEFLARRAEPFFEDVAVDILRRSFRGYGVSGTPTIVWIDGRGFVRQRQVGYDPAKGLRFEGWPGSTP